MPTKVFVSHSHKDDHFTSRLVADLKHAGAEVWVDVADLGAGDFQERINKALNWCEAVVLVLTKDALASKWVTQEINAANSLIHEGRIKHIMGGRITPSEGLLIRAYYIVRSFPCRARRGDSRE